MQNWIKDPETGMFVLAEDFEKDVIKRKQKVIFDYLAQSKEKVSE